MEEVKELRIQKVEKDKQLSFLKARIADLEEHTRANDVIMGCGLNPAPTLVRRLLSEAKRPHRAGSLDGATSGSCFAIQRP